EPMPLTTPPLEAWFNQHESGAAYSLGGTMVQPWTGEALQEFLPEDWGPHRFEFGYVPTPGSHSLRTLLASEYDLSPDAIFLTAGATEANLAVLTGMLRPGSNVILQDPLYYQFEAIAHELGAEVRRWTLPADPAQAPDLSALAALIDAETRLVVLNTPHNPTGRTLDADTLRAAVTLVEAQPEAHLLIDEIYRGVGPHATPSALGLSDRILVTDAVSKRWSLPGLRLGWVASRSSQLATCLPYHEHATCCVSRLSEQVIEALWPRRAEVFAENHRVTERNRQLFAVWLASVSRLLDGALPPAGVVTLVWPRFDSDDREVARALREDFGLFVLPGSTLGYPGALRVGFGQRDPVTLLAALARFETGLDALAGRLA
ncbi:MAG TPA: aminotransferase class I/II-fold pyridoxal phosphate-dependent enzyme, partial [Stenomitos sp.]